MLLYHFSTATTLSKMIYVLQHIIDICICNMYYPIPLSPSCFHLFHWVSFVGFGPEFGIGKTIFCDHNIFTTSVGSLNPVLRPLQSLTFSSLCLHNHPHLYGFAPDNLWDKYKNRPLLFTWTCCSSLKVSQPSESPREWYIPTSFNQKDLAFVGKIQWGLVWPPNCCTNKHSLCLISSLTF